MHIASIQTHLVHWVAGEKKEEGLSCTSYFKIQRQYFFFFLLFWARPATNGSSQARGQIGAIAIGL